MQATRFRFQRDQGQILRSVRQQCQKRPTTVSKETYTIVNDQGQILRSVRQFRLVRVTLKVQVSACHIERRSVRHTFFGGRYMTYVSSSSYDTCILLRVSVTRSQIKTGTNSLKKVKEIKDKYSSALESGVSGTDSQIQSTNQLQINSQ